MGKGIRSNRKKRQHREEVRKRLASKSKKVTIDDELIRNELNELENELNDKTESLENNNLETDNKNQHKSLQDIANQLCNKIYKDEVDDKQLMKMLKNMSSDPKILNMLNMLK